MRACSVAVYDLLSNLLQTGRHEGRLGLYRYQSDFGSLYVGVTSDLLRRVREHRQGTGSRFTARYRLTRLVYFEWHEDIRAAIARETRLKHWPRVWKLSLIEAQNPAWDDLYAIVVGKGDH